MARPPSDWISLSEASAIFAAAGIPITTGTLARWAKDGRLQSIRPGRLIYVRRAQVRSMLTPRKRGVPAESIQPGMFEDWAE